MKRQSSTRESINLGVLLCSQENSIKKILDEVSILESLTLLWDVDFHQHYRSEGVDKSLINPQLKNQVKIYKRVLFEFPLKKMSQHIDGFYLHCEALASVMLCFSQLKAITRSPDLSSDKDAQFAFDESMEHLEKALELIQDVKKRNDII
jgi:hypothetical protein